MKASIDYQRKCLISVSEKTRHDLSWKYLRTVFSLFGIFVFMTSLTNSILFPKMLTRFCYNSPEPGRVNVSMKDVKT